LGKGLNQNTLFKKKCSKNYLLKKVEPKQPFEKGQVQQTEPKLLF